MRVHFWPNWRTQHPTPVSEPKEKRHCQDCGIVLNSYHDTYCYGCEDKHPESVYGFNLMHNGSSGKGKETAPTAVIRALLCSDEERVELPSVVIERYTKIDSLLKTYRDLIREKDYPVLVRKDGGTVWLERTDVPRTSPEPRYGDAMPESV